MTEDRAAHIPGSRLAGLVAVLCLAGCSATQQVDPASQQLATPASRYCATEGGKRAVERSRDGEIAVCVFAGNRQCEEWALLRGDCPRGGLPVGGYATTWERHCAIQGGHMTIPGCALTPVGLYERTLPPPGGDERNMTVVLDAGRVAMVSMASSGGAIRYLAPGKWESDGTVVTVSTEDERLVFDYTGDRLVAREWDRNRWGKAGPGTLLRKR